ncbi:MAG: hypothetical protein QMD92_05000 [bacterium]|nr:hypothetical protein [bacterium]
MDININETKKLINQLSLEEIKSLYIFEDILKKPIQDYVKEIKKKE